MTSIPLLVLAAMITSPTGSYEPPIEIPEGCHMTHYLADGRRIERPASGAPVRYGEGRSAAAAARSSDAGSVSSSVSASASSSSSGAVRSQASAQAVGDGRRITTTEDDSGCQIVIDDRAAGETR